MEAGLERLDLLHEPVDQPLAGHIGQRRNVIDRFLRIEFGALSPGAIENIDNLAFDIEESELEHCKKTAGARSDDHGVSCDDFGTHSNCP
jgi:hypothetical protein